MNVLPTQVLADSLSVKINGWEPTPDQIQKITDYVVGVHIPIRGNTFNISTLQEIAGGHPITAFYLTVAWRTLNTKRSSLSWPEKWKDVLTTLKNKLLPR